MPESKTYDLDQLMSTFPLEERAYGIAVWRHGPCVSPGPGSRWRLS